MLCKSLVPVSELFLKQVRVPSSSCSTWWDMAALAHMMQHAHITHMYSNATKDERITTAFPGANLFVVHSAGKHHVNTSMQDLRCLPSGGFARHKDASAAAYAPRRVAVSASCGESALSETKSECTAASRRPGKHFAMPGTTFPCQPFAQATGCSGNGGAVCNTRTIDVPCFCMQLRILAWICIYIYRFVAQGSASIHMEFANVPWGVMHDTIVGPRVWHGLSLARVGQDEDTAGNEDIWGR